MDQPQLAVYKLTEKYFINTIVVQLKAYVMLQLSYLTRATKVRFIFTSFHFHKKKEDGNVDRI